MTKFCPKFFVYLFTAGILLVFFLFITPSNINAQNLNSPTVSGSDVTFTWAPNPGFAYGIGVWTTNPCPTMTTARIWGTDFSTGTGGSATWSGGTAGTTYYATLYTLSTTPVSNCQSFTVGGGGGGGGGFTVDLNTSLGGKLPTFGPAAVVTFIVQILIVAAFILAFIFLLLGGIRWITAGGDEKAIAGARGMITGALIGLIIVLAAYTIIKLIEYFFNVKIISGTLTIPSIGGP